MTSIRAHDVKGTAVRLSVRIRYPWLLLPVAVTLLSFRVISLRMPVDYEAWFQNGKAFWETRALEVLAAAACVAVVRLVMSRFLPFLVWLTTLVLILLMREIHWCVMSVGVYVGIAVLLAIAWWQFDLLKAQFSRPLLPTVLAMIFVSYAISVTLDGQWWTATERMDTVGQLAEEIVEVFGHVMVLVLVFCVRLRSAAALERSGMDVGASVDSRLVTDA